VQDADESVAQGAQGLVVEVSDRAVLIVERSGAWAVVDSAESPLVDGVVEPSIAHAAGQDGMFLAGCDGQG
jgi:hypothetical protein